MQMFRTFVLIVVFVVWYTYSDEVTRKKRAYFIYPMGGQFKYETEQKFTTLVYGSVNSAKHIYDAILQTKSPNISCIFIELVLGLAIPVKLGLKQSMAYGLNMQFQYAVATNSTQLEEYPPIVSKRSKRELKKSDRSVMYLALESLMNRYGISGQSCMLRSICDNAMESLHHDSNGLYGHLMHIILSPDYGDGEVDADLDPLYYDAQKAGMYGVDCVSLYPDCPYGHGIFDLVTLLDT